MPVLKNLETGLAEDLPQEVANSALTSGTHEIPLVSPQGEHGSAKPEDAAQLVQQGYRQPKTEELVKDLSTAKHSSTLEKVQTGIEGLAHGVLGPVADVMSEAFEIPQEDIAARQEINPGIHAAAEATGLIGAALAGVGLGGALNKIGAIAKASKDASFIAKVAATAGRGAIENAVFQAQDEVSKMIQNDPNQTAESAIANVGMSGLLGAGIGGGLGGVGASWNAFMGSKAGKFLEDFKGMTKQHLGLENGPQYSDKQMSPFAKPDIFMPNAKGYPEVDFASTPGGKVANALIRNGLEEQIAGAIGAVGGSSMGHPILGYLFGKNTITPMIKKILPAIMRPILDSETSGTGLKSAVNYAMNAIKGENAIGKASAAIFGEASDDISSVSEKDREKLKEQLSELSNDPNKLLEVGKETGYYMPEHAQALANTAVKNVQYLQSLKPIVAPKAPLDSPRETNKVEDATYNRALDIAQSPLIVTKAIKDGSLTIKDIGHLKTMYPALYNSLTQKITAQMIDKKTDKGSIPYKTRLGLSAFLGQPLDSSMSSMAIMASQGQGMTQQQAQQPKNGTASKNMNKLDKLPEQFNTMVNSREAYRAGRH